MSVKIRLSRVGKKHVPFFRVVAVDSRKKRDGAVLENLGTYDALNSKVIQLNQGRIDEWIAKGAIASDTVKRVCRLYKKAADQPIAKEKKAAPKAKKAAKEKQPEPAKVEAQEPAQSPEEKKAESSEKK